MLDYTTPGSPIRVRLAEIAPFILGEKKGEKIENPQETSANNGETTIITGIYWKRPQLPETKEKLKRREKTIQFWKHNERIPSRRVTFDKEIIW
ncbi:hypothetical protein Y032_0498g2514 [Ancylostoma ceylanicum]|nr:hypothetical protein Y032_0498g2514 [Ancylostoma ceylanicum]